MSLKRYKYCGKERDEETGLYYYGARYYAAWICRFVSVDPLQYSYPNYTPYQYAGNNPVTLTDINGAYPSGDGPDKFAVSANANSSEVLNDGTRVTYVSGESGDIEMYQQMFEEHGVLDFDNTVLINSYFESVYGVAPYGWASRGEFGNEVNRKRVIDLFEIAGAFYGVDPSLLYTYAMGEGMYYLRDGNDIGNNSPIHSFEKFGIDFFGSDVGRYTFPSGYNFISGGTVGRNTDPNFQNGATYITITEEDGSPFYRGEARDDAPPSPVHFINIDYAIIGASAVYAAAYHNAAAEAIALGWGELNQNQNVFFGYYKIQAPSESLAGEYTKSANFFNLKIDKINKQPDKYPGLSYQRWVEWRYVRMSGYFSR